MEGLILTGLAGKLLYDIAGPFAKELGEMVKDELRPYRARQQARLAEKSVRMLQEAHIQPSPVQPKLLLTIFDNAGLEDDEDLHTMWAALLANAAVPSSDKVLPAFPEILRQLTSVDALFLRDIYIQTVLTERDRHVISGDGAAQIEQRFYQVLGQQERAAFEITMKNLERLGLIVISKRFADFIARHVPSPSDGTESLTLTTFGRRFVEACEAPSQIGQRPVLQPVKPAEERRIARDLEKHKLRIYTTNVTNYLNRELLALKNFILDNPELLTNNKENSDFFNTWLQDPFIEMGPVAGMWSKDKLDRLRHDLQTLHA